MSRRIGKTRLTIAVNDGLLDLRLRIRVRALLAVLAAAVSSPALIAALTRLLG